MTRHMAPIKIPKLAQAPVIDGKLNEWPAPAATMDKADCFDHGSQAKGFADYRRPRDCEAKIRLGWNDTNLYVAVEVEDDLLFTTQPQGQGRSAQMAPLQDMLRFGFARVDEAGLQIAAAYQVAPPSQARKPLEQSGVGDMSDAGGDKGAHLPLPAETAPVQRKLLRPVGREQAKLIRDIEKELPKIPMAVNLTKKEDGNYRIVYEIALPWKLTGLFVARQPESPPAKDGPGDAGAEKPRQGLEFGLLLNVRDQDESVIVKWLGLGPDDIESDRTHSYVPVVLE
jgi:hypothetical protein